MSTFYMMSGTVKTRACEEVRLIVTEFNRVCGGPDCLGVTYQDNEDGTAEVEFAGGSFMTYTATGELDAIVEQLSEYALELTKIHTDCDGEMGWIYIGPPDQQALYDSEEALEQIMELLSSLLPPHKDHLRDALDGI